MEHFFLIFFSSVNAVPFSELVIIFIIIIIIILFLSLNNPEMYIARKAEASNYPIRNFLYDHFSKCFPLKPIIFIIIIIHYHIIITLITIIIIKVKIINPMLR